jgi:hypothetical protein
MSGDDRQRSAPAPATAQPPAQATLGTRQTPFLMPAGMPPGLDYIHEDRPPEGVYYFRLYAGFMCFWHGAMAIGGLIFMLKPIFSPSPGGADWGSWLLGGIYGLYGMALFVPTAIALFGGRKGWVHTVGTIVIALGMMQLCCLPILIPLLVTWLKPETKRWYGG